MVTGALGFIGSNLCRTLADLGADVLAVDSLLPDYGGNLFNLAGYEDKVRINIADVRGHAMEYLVRGQEVLFNLAGQVSHIDSMTDPFTDLEINCRSQLWILEAVRKNNPDVKMVYAGTRQVYGKPKSLPVDETHLLNPTDVNGINKISGEFYHLVYHSVYGIRASSLRLTNTYGPRQLIRHPRQGFIGWFMRQVVLGEEIQLFGDGGQKRDFDYVDDVVDAFLRAGAMDAADGQVFNLGGEEPVSLLDLVKMMIEIAGQGSLQRGALPARAGAHRHRRLLRRRDQDPQPRWAGSPGSPLRDGLARTIEYYRAAQGPLPVTRGRPLRRLQGPRAGAAAGDRRRGGAGAGLRLVHPRPGGRGLRARARGLRWARGRRSAVANGTEAIQLALEALGVGAGRRGRSRRP